MSGRTFLLYRQRPTARQVRVALVIAATLAASFLAAFPFRNIKLPEYDGYVPAVESVTMLGDLVIASLLFSHASVTRSKALLALAAGYLFSGIAVTLHFLTFPGAFGPSGLLGGGVNTSGWLGFLWHIAVPIGAISYALLKDRYWRDEGAASSRNIIVTCTGGVALLAFIAGFLVTRGHAILPVLMSDSSRWMAGQVPNFTLPLAGVTVVAMAMVWRRYGSILDLWLLVILWNVFLDFCMTASISGRFTLGWYVLKALGCISGLPIFWMLLAQTNKLYLDLIVHASEQERERERQVLVRDAIAASIAHEIKQPLAAIEMNAHAALGIPARDILGSHLLQDIQNDSRRAMDLIKSTRELYSKSAGSVSSSGINHLIRDTLAMDARHLRNHRVTVELALAEGLPDAVINRLQMQQVFLNLFMNAAEAMSVSSGPRILKIGSCLRGDSLVISVQDTGPGIHVDDHDRVFAPFFTTKDTGTGLGLAICQSVVEGHGGSLRVVQHAGQGALFEIQLPFERAADPERTGAKDPAGKGRATLGDVLYAKSKNPVREHVWAGLVQSIAAGDQLALHALYEMAHRVVFNFILQMTADRKTSEELTLDVFHDIWRDASGYDAANGTVLAWIMNLARARAMACGPVESTGERNIGIHVHAEMAAGAQGDLALRIARETGKGAVPPPPRQWREPEWEQVAPGIECKLLATDTERQRVSMMVRLAPGASYPAHTHAGVEELFLLDGELWIDERKLFPGDYNYGAPGEGDDRVWSATGCSCVLVTSTRDVLRV